MRTFFNLNLNTKIVIFFILFVYIYIYTGLIPQMLFKQVFAENVETINNIPTTDNKQLLKELYLSSEEQYRKDVAVVVVITSLACISLLAIYIIDCYDYS